MESQSNSHSSAHRQRWCCLIQNTLKGFLSNPLTEHSAAEQHLSNKLQVMFYSRFTQTGNTPTYAGKNREVPEEYQEQPQRKRRDVWKQKYFMLHLMHCLSSIFRCHLWRKAGRLLCSARLLGRSPRDRLRPREGSSSTAATSTAAEQILRTKPAL